MEVDVPQIKGVKRKADVSLEPPKKLQVCTQCFRDSILQYRSSQLTCS